MIWTINEVITDRVTQQSKDCINIREEEGFQKKKEEEKENEGGLTEE